MITKPKWFKIRKPEDPAAQFVGRKITCYKTADDCTNRVKGEKLTVEHIAGNLTHQTMFQINGSHLVSMLDAYCELNKEPIPDLETHQQFLDTKADHIVQERTHIERGPKRVS